MFDFNYHNFKVYCVSLNQVGSMKSYKSMNKYNRSVLLAVLGLLIAGAAIALSFRASVNAESLIGYVSVFAMLSVAALEYRITWKRLLGRG